VRAIGAQPPISRPQIGLYHLAWGVSSLSELERLASRLQERDALTGAADHRAIKVIYGSDPDGIMLELSWLAPSALLSLEEVLGARPRNLDQEKDTYSV
jgi:catechol-2,3-dioxygenase